MRPFALLLVPLLAGCAGPAAELAASSGPADDAPLAPATEVALDAASGEFLVATYAPAQDPPCPGAGTTLSPEPSPGAWVSWTLPAETAIVRIAFAEDAATGGTMYRLCPFADDAALDPLVGSAPLDGEIPVAGASELRILISPDGELGAALVNGDAQVRWTLEGVALTPAPAATA